MALVPVSLPAATRSRKDHIAHRALTGVPIRQSRSSAAPDQVTEGNSAPPPPGRCELAGRPLTTTPAPGAYARFLSLDASDWQTKTSPDATEPNAVSLDVRTSLPCRQLVPRDSGSGLFSHLHNVESPPGIARGPLWHAQAFVAVVSGRLFSLTPASPLALTCF